MGDGIGGTEKKLGVAANREECINMVKIREPNANGATFPNSAGPGNCYAEFQMIDVNAETEKYQTCPFYGMSLFDSLNKFKILSNLTKNETIVREEKFLLGPTFPYQCKDGFCIYGLSDEIYGTPLDVANACLKADQECKAYDYAADEGYGHLCKYPDSEDCSDVAEGSGDDCGDYEYFQICIKTPGKFHFLILGTYFYSF